MNIGGPGGGGSSLPSGSIEGGEFVEEGEILLGKLVSTLLGGVWLTIVAGWVAISEAIVQVHINVVNAAAATQVRIIRAFGEGGADTLEVGWASAFRAAVEAEPLLAPVIFSAEVVVVTAILLWARRRWADV